MRKWMVSLGAGAAALTLACSAALADETLHAHLNSITDTANPAHYVIATTEYDIMEPTGDRELEFFAEGMKGVELIPADASETPEGEYVVLSFPEENVRFDFWMPDENTGSYIRQVNADGSEELFRAVVPEDAVEPGLLMSAAADALADAHGLAAPVEALLPEEGWVLESVMGAVWQDDRASLEVFLEDTENYKVLITWGNSAWESTEWTFACDYDAESQGLKAVHVICDEVVTDEAGNETRRNISDSESQAVFTLNEDGRVVIRDAGEEILEGKTFEKVQ